VALRSILVVADDLTGAADSAVQFRRAGFSAVVLAQLGSHRSPWPWAQVVSLSLNTRDASPAAVRRIWEHQAPTIRTLAQDALVYHKIDSTLRGHPGLEVRLLLGCLGAANAIIAPAFPKLGRHTVDGVHRVGGIPLAETEYIRSRRRSRRSSYLPDLLTAGDDARPIHLPWQVIDSGVEVVAQWLRERLTEPCRLITADAADERHFDTLTQAVLPLVGRVLLVGSAGWAERLAMACKGSLAATPGGPGALGVVGSLSTVATRQVEVASRAGTTVVQWVPPAAYAQAGGTAHDWHAVAHTLAAGRSVVLWTNPGGQRAASPSAGPRVLHRVAHAVCELLSITPVSGLMIVGGDTAQSVFRALRASGLVLTGEVAPGVPYGRLLNGPFAGLLTATKAGGFGADMILEEGLKFLQSESSQ
jgi:D-threonate/D-erythronate kinase